MVPGAPARHSAGRTGVVLPVVADATAAEGLPELGTERLAVRPVLQDGGAAKRRNAAFRAVRGDVVVLNDDDDEPLAGYGAAPAAQFAGDRGVVVQGAVWPEFEVEPPEELRPSLFRVGGFNRVGDARRDDVFISANCAFGREVLERVGPMREDFGPGSGGIAWGDDTEWHDRATRLGIPTVTDDGIAVRHRVQADRLTVDAVLARAERVGRTLARLDWDARSPGTAARLRQRALAAWASLKSGRDLESRCLARRLRGYADELARIR